MSEWKLTVLEHPPENVVVDTKIDDAKGLRNEQQLKFSGNLWWFTDGSMYVYYTPTHWRFTSEPSYETLVAWMRKELHTLMMMAKRERKRQYGHGG